MNLGNMGADTLQNGTVFTTTETVQLGQGAPGTPGGTFLLSTTTAAVEGNALWASVYSHGQYASMFSDSDIAQMTWDRSGFWPQLQKKITYGEQEPGELILSPSVLFDSTTTAAMAEIAADRAKLGEINAWLKDRSYGFDFSMWSVGASWSDGALTHDWRTGQVYGQYSFQIGASVDFRWGPPLKNPTWEEFWIDKHIGYGHDSEGGRYFHLGLGLGPFYGISEPLPMY